MSFTALLILMLYIILMVILTVYAAHAYLMMYLYYRNRSGRQKTAVTFKEWPAVTVQLPLFNERYVVERLIRAAGALTYPKDKLEIQVLDDSTDETQDLAQQLVAELRAQGLRVEYRHRSNRAGFKAGALKAGLETARGEFIAIFDADFVPPPDFLIKMLPHFAADNIGLVQARWGHLNHSYSLLTRGQAIALDAHFVLEHGARNASGIFINFNGTAGIWRKTAIISAGNWSDDTLTEDMDLSYRAQLTGWKFVYVNDMVCPAEIPAEVNGLKTQQYRWAKGAIQTARKLLPQIWKNRTIPLLVKFEATVHLTNHLVFPVLLLLSLLYYPILLIGTQTLHAQPFFLAMSLFAANIFSYPLFYIQAQREIYADWKRRVLFLPILMIGALGLSVINSRAVFSALMGRRGVFTRTPKYSLTDTPAHSWRGKVYHSRFNMTTLVELLCIGYMSLALAFALQHQQYVAVPFILLYWLGFAFIGSLSFLHAFKR